jgi:hypothetical protein
MALPHLLRLPVELHLGVIDKLGLHDRVNLASTNLYFRSIVKPPTHDDYLLAESSDWATTRNMFACSRCTRIRGYKKFADEMRKGRYSRGGAHAALRLCLSCGADTGLYTLGAIVFVWGEVQVLCKVCRAFPNDTTCQVACAECTPAARPSSASSTSTNQRQYTREHPTSRSARVFIDSTHEDELYAAWRDA